MAYSPPTGDEVDFDFADALESPPTNFDFREFDIVPVKVAGAIFRKEL